MNGITEGMTMQDKFEKIGKSVIQHGTFNNRIYLLKLAPDETEDVVQKMDELAEKEGYTKIIAKIHSDKWPQFLLGGYSIEAYIPDFYNGETDCLLVSKFIDEERRKIPVEKIQSFTHLLETGGNNGNRTNANHHNFSLRELGENDAVAISEIFKHVFETYPFPVHDPEYLKKTMRDKMACYYGIWDENDLIGISTAETDLHYENAEMTDFAVLPEYRGQNLALHLLDFMEKEMRAEGIKTVYTIARLGIPGMNKTFMKSGYKYTGTLVKNTHIGGSIESMNIFYKKL